jgi:hypothetical protein
MHKNGFAFSKSRASGFFVADNEVFHDEPRLVCLFK